MRVRQKLTSRTHQIGVRVRETVFERIRRLAAHEGKSPSEWASDRLADVTHGVPSPFQRAILAEICATQDILVNLLYALRSGEKLTRERVQQITSAAHASKYREADELLKNAPSLDRGIHNSTPNSPATNPLV
jgi:hypothetical protein